MNPPHLPPKTSNLESHRVWQRLKLLLGITIFSLIVGASGASIMVGWIWPKFAEGDMWIASYTRQGISRAQLESRVREEVSERVVSIYRGSLSINTANYFNKKIGDGIMLSSDGWIALYQPQYDGNFKNIYVTEKSGNVYQPENAIWDKYSGLLYLKIANEQFKVFGFEDEKYNPDEVFIWQNNDWYRTQILYPVFNYKIPHLDTAPIRSYSFEGSFGAGDVVINNQGRSVGFVTADNTVLPSYYITRFLTKILSGQTVLYPSLGVEGWFSEEQPIFVTNEEDGKIGKKVQGFLVSNSISPSNLLRKGDIILKINGEIVAHDNLWYTISDKESVRVVVLRNQKELNLTVKVQSVK